ncbi:hypothetical protein V8B97DRAFT_2023543 [Scleroderma yunnanense]
MHDYSFGHAPHQSVQTPVMFHNTHSHHGYQSQEGIPLSSNLNPVHLLAEEIKRIHEVVLAMNKLQTKLAGLSKNILNQHPKLKPILHNKVHAMCGVDRLGSMDRLTALGQNLDRLPNHVSSEEVDGQVVWRPVWSVQVDHTINVSFLHVVVDSIMEEEKMKCMQSRAELNDSDYVTTTIMMMAKSYWQTLASDIHSTMDSKKQTKHTVSNTGKHHHSRRVQTIDEDSLSKDLNAQHKVQDIPNNGWMRVGLTWQLLDYIAFLHILNNIHKQQCLADTNDVSSQPISPSNASGPAPKCQKTTKKKDNLTRVFDLHPLKMDNRAPWLGKSKPTVPFKIMFNEAWLAAYPGQKTLDGMEWLNGFYLQAKMGDLSVSDQAYLDELAEYLAENLDD